MSERMKDLQRLRAKGIETARQIVAAAEGEGQARLDAAQEAGYARAMADVEKYAVAIEKQRLDDTNELLMAESRGRFLAPTGLGGTAAIGPSETELRAFMTPGSPVNQYWVRPPREQVMGPASKFAESRAAFLTTDTATIGSAYYFTTELYREVVMGLLAASGVLEADPTMVVTNHLRDISVPVLQVDATAAAGTEGSAATETNPQGDHVVLGHFRYDGKFKVPVEMVMSAEYNLDNLLSTFATRAISNKTAEMLALGNGTTQPAGVFTSLIVAPGVTTAESTSTYAAEMIALTKSVSKGYRKQAKLVVSDVLHTLMLQWTDDNGAYLMRTIEGGGTEFCGKPLFTEPQADQTSISAGEVHAVYGDWASGLFVRTTPMFLQRRDNDPLNAEVTFAIWLDAKIADASALAALTMKA